MNTLKRKLTAILLTFAMLFSLMPVLPQTAEAAEAQGNGYVTLSYDNEGAIEKNITVNVFYDGNQVDTFSVNDAKAAGNSIKIAVNNPNEYEIENIQPSHGTVTEKNVSSNQASFRWTFDGDSAAIMVDLCEPFEAPTDIENELNSTTVRYNISEAQLLKMLYVSGVTDVSATTEIESVQPLWVESFGATSNQEFDFIGVTAGNDYWELPAITSDSGDPSDVNPENLRGFKITYNSGGEDQVVTVYSKDMSFVGVNTGLYYQVSSNHNDVHAVAFYNESDLNTADQYDLYAIRFVVDPDQNIGEKNMPEDPVYNEALTDYKFVNWEIDAYYGDNGEAFLATTIVDRDMNVYAHKVSSSYSGGTYIRLMNKYDGEINQLIDRLVEGYNDKYNANILADQIDESTIKVRVYGVNNEYTNENYYSNDWSGTEYYLVHNYDAPGVPGGIDVNQNTHVGFNEVSSVTVYFSLNGEKDIATIEIPVGNNAGDLAKMMKGVGADHILQLYVIQEGQVVSGESEDPDPEPPVEPTIDELRSLIEVAVNCQADEEHNKGSNAGTYALAEDTYDVIVDPDTNTATVTVQGQPYVNLLTKDFGVHQISGDISKQVVAKYTDEGWVLNNPSAATPMVLTFSATCSGGTTPEPGDSITAFTKDVVTAEVTEPALEIPEDVKISYPAGENNTVTAHEGDNVTLLYKITVEGKKDTTFTVKDDGAIFVGVSPDVEVTDKSGEFTATIPEGGKVDLYVIKTFTDIKLDASPLTNEATISINDGSITQGEDSDEEEVPVEVIPDGPTDEELEALNLKVKLDCVSNVGHSDGTYELTAESCSYEKDKIAADSNGIYTVPVVVDSAFYLDKYNEDSKYEGHTISEKDQPVKMVTLTYQNNVWTVEDNDKVVVFAVVCDAQKPGDYVVDQFGKALVETVEEANKAGITNATNYNYPKNGVVTIERGKDITLLYKLTIEGKANVEFNVTDQGTKLVLPVDGSIAQNGDVYSGTIGADGSTTFYVAKTFDAADITLDDQKNPVLVNSASIVADTDGDGKPDPDDESGVKPGEEDKDEETDVTTEFTLTFEYDHAYALDANNERISEGQTITVDCGDDFDFTARPNSGYILDVPTIDGRAELKVNTSTNFTVENIISDVVVFVDATKQGGGIIVVPGGDDDDNLGDNDGPSGLNTEDHFSYVVGYEDGMVKPQRSITRAEVATIFYRLLEDDVRDDYDTTRNNFSDVTSDSWYNQTVSTLASMGILKGYEDGTFRPNASITRAEFAAIATRFFEETGATYEPGTFTDVTGDEWFAGAIMDAVNLGLIGGYEDGTVRPNNNITRAEACAIVNRTLGRVPDADHLLPADEMTTWPDNPSSAWFYADMQEATNGHEYEWITEDGNKIEEWTDILDKDWNDR